MPSEEWGRHELYSSRHASILSRAFFKVLNQFSFRHSSRKRPLKLSANPFSMGLPGRINAMCTLFSKAQIPIALLVNSLPLSVTIVSGKPRSSLRISNVLATRVPLMEVSTTIRRHSLVNRSMIFRQRNLLQSASDSDTKSMAQI